ncbi:MAG: DUF1700 domain-containing protein [Clostridia bacterium]|nr:DUF1700 domain-containing protein [Clostridia bacterium]
MTKNEFLNRLDGALTGIAYQDRKDIIYDYEEHFTVGLEGGKTEEEIAASLGDPVTIARQFKADYMLKKAESKATTSNLFKAVFAVVGMGFFNLLIILPIFLPLWAAMIALIFSAFCVVLGGVAGFFASVGTPFFESIVTLPTYNTGANIFFCIGIIALGLLYLIGVISLGKLFYRGTMKYLKFNLKFIKDRGQQV